MKCKKLFVLFFSYLFAHRQKKESKRMRLLELASRIVINARCYLSWRMRIISKLKRNKTIYM